CGLRLSDRDRSAPNGKKKCPKIRNTPICHHPSLKRVMKNGVSSGSPAIQISRSCENAMYVQKQVNASISLPMLCVCSMFMPPPNTFLRLACQVTMARIDSDDRKLPAT